MIAAYMCLAPRTSASLIRMTGYSDCFVDFSNGANGVSFTSLVSWVYSPVLMRFIDSHL